MSSHAGGIEHKVILTCLNTNKRYVNKTNDKLFSCKVLFEETTNTFYISDINFHDIICTYLDTMSRKSFASKLKFSLDTEIVLHPGEIVYLTDDFTLQIVKYIPTKAFNVYEQYTT